MFVPSKYGMSPLCFSASAVLLCRCNCNCTVPGVRVHTRYPSTRVLYPLLLYRVLLLVYFYDTYTRTSTVYRLPYTYLLLLKALPRSRKTRSVLSSNSHLSQVSSRSSFQFFPFRSCHNARRCAPSAPYFCTAVMAIAPILDVVSCTIKEMSSLFLVLVLFVPLMVRRPDKVTSSSANNT